MSLVLLRFSRLTSRGQGEGETANKSKTFVLSGAHGIYSKPIHIFYFILFTNKVKRFAHIAAKKTARHAEFGYQRPLTIMKKNLSSIRHLFTCE